MGTRSEKLNRSYINYDSKKDDEKNKKKKKKKIINFVY